MKKQKVNYYFESFIELFDYTQRAVEYLQKLVNEFDGGVSEEQVQEMHVIEHGGDETLHNVLSKLAKEFITPIENEDLLAIIKKIDDATDVIEDVVIQMYIHNVKHLFDGAVEFVDIIKRECDMLAIVLKEFPNFKNAKDIKEKILAVLSIEEEGDKLYMASVRKLFTSTDDAKELLLTENLIKGFEKCCDVLEEVVQVVDEAIMKNS